MVDDCSWVISELGENLIILRSILVALERIVSSRGSNRMLDSYLDQ